MQKFCIYKIIKLLYHCIFRNDNRVFLTNKRKGISVIVLMFSGFAIMALAALVIDLGIIFNSRYEFQKLIETTALASVADYNAYEDNANTIRYPTDAQIDTNANSSVNNNLNAFVASNSFLLISKNITPTVHFGATIQSRYSRAIRIDATAIMRTFFLNFVGIRSVELQASAAASHIPLYLRAGNILNGVGAYRDTQIRGPNGGTANNQTINGIVYATPAIVNVNTSFSNIYGMHNGTALSLGPGGYITIKLPSALVDGRGFDLEIRTLGNANGYFVFAGNDTNPANPYVDAVTPGGGISWVNISCTGTPIGTTTNGRVGSYIQNVGGGIGNQAKFYGSGYFDLGVACSNGYNSNIHSAKYLKIIDDNIEDGFIMGDPEYQTSIAGVPAFFPGQHSSFTPGVSIDSIAIEHHPRLISISDFGIDTDNDGLLDVFENALGLGPCGPSDGGQNCGAPPASDDAREYWGFTALNINNIIIDNATNALRIDYANRSDNPPKMYINY